MINPVPRGSKVGIVSPSSALDSPEDIRDGLRWLESCGYRVVLGTHVYDRLNHMAGTPEQQAEDLMRFFADPEIRAVFAAAGCFGCWAVSVRPRWTSPPSLRGRCSCRGLPSGAAPSCGTG